MGGLDFLGDLLDTGPSNFVESASGFGGGGVPNISLAGSVFDPSNLTSMVPSMGGDLSGGGGGGFAGWLDKLGTGTQDILGKIGKSFTDDPFGSLLKTAQIGVAGAGVAAGIKGAQAGAQQAQIARQVENRAERMGEIQEKATARREEVAAVAEKRQEEITQPAADFAKTVTEAGKTGLLTGQLPPGLEAVVQDKMQRLRTDITSYLAKTGNADSTMARQWDTWSRRCPDRKSTRLNSSHLGISYAVVCLKRKK